MTRTIMTSLAVLVTAMPVWAEDVTYDVEGVEHTGYFASADDDADGLVILVHDWNGIDEFERSQADEMADEGYDVFVIDMFGADTPTGTMEQNRAASSELGEDREKMRMLLRAGLDQAQSRSDADRMVVAGYCFGGGVALEMARSDFADRAAGFGSFHGSLGTPEGQSYSSEAAPILIMHGGADEAQPLNVLNDLVQELEQAGATYTAEIYAGAPHGFTEPGESYQERAAMESREAFNDFLEERLDD